jgi:hypothetical protein
MRITRQLLLFRVLQNVLLLMVCVSEEPAFNNVERMPDREANV